MKNKDTSDLFQEIIDRLRKIEKTLDPEEEIPEQLMITPSDLSGATRPKLEKFVRQLHVKIPPYMLREAIQRHLQRYGQLVELIEQPPASKPVEEKIPPPPWTPQKGMSVQYRKTKKSKPKRGVLGKTKKGNFLVKFKDGTKIRFTETDLSKHVTPYEKKVKKK